MTERGKAEAVKSLDACRVVVERHIIGLDGSGAEEAAYTAIYDIGVYAGACMMAYTQGAISEAELDRRCKEFTAYCEEVLDMLIGQAMEGQDNATD